MIVEAANGQVNFQEGVREGPYKSEQKQPKKVLSQGANKMLDLGVTKLYSNSNFLGSKRLSCILVYGCFQSVRDYVRKNQVFRRGCGVFEPCTSAYSALMFLWRALLS